MNISESVLLPFPVKWKQIYSTPDAGEEGNFHCLLLRFPRRKVYRHRKFYRRHRFYIGYKVLFTHRVFSLPVPDACKVSGSVIAFIFDINKFDRFLKDQEVHNKRRPWGNPCRCVFYVNIQKISSNEGNSLNEAKTTNVEREGRPHYCPIPPRALAFFVFLLKFYRLLRLIYNDCIHLHQPLGVGSGENRFQLPEATDVSLLCVEYHKNRFHAAPADNTAILLMSVAEDAELSAWPAGAMGLLCHSPLLFLDFDCFCWLMCVHVLTFEQPVIVSGCTGCHDIFTSYIFLNLRKNPGQRHLRRAGVPRIAYVRTKFRLSW